MRDGDFVRVVGDKGKGKKENQKDKATKWLDKK